MTVTTTPDPGRQVSLQKIYLRDASLEIPAAPQVFTREWKPEVDVQISTSVQGVGTDQHHVVLTVTVTAKLDKDVAFLAEVQQAGIFLIKGMGDADKQHVLGAECPAILFPYAREAVSELVTRGGFPQLLLQPVNFEVLFRQHLERNAEPATARAH